MKTITVNITHDEVFEDFVKNLSKEKSKASEILIDDNNIVINITKTLAELEND